MFLKRGLIPRYNLSILRIHWSCPYKQQIQAAAVAVFPAVLDQYAAAVSAALLPAVLDHAAPALVDVGVPDIGLRSRLLGLKMLST